jgi:arabinogalactan oligomer/maltooligosaccharide transport system permease protein
VTQGKQYLAALVALCVFVLVSSPASAEPIRLWHAYRGDEEKALEEIVARWKGDPVELLALPADALKSKLSSAISLGDGPDLFIDAHNRLGEYKFRKLVAPVGDALEEGVYAGPSLEAMRVGDVAYGVPISQKSVALYVNTDLVDHVPEDLEGIAELKGKLPPGVFPLAYESQNFYFHAGLLHAAGGKVITDKDEFGFVGPEAAKSLELTLWLQSSGTIPEEADGALVTNLFRSGRAAFAISGPWLATDLAGATSLHYRVAPLPKVRATGRYLEPLLTVEAIMLSPRGAARVDVRALARHIASPEGAKIRAERAHTLPARQDAALPEGDAALRAFAEQAKRTVPMSTSPAMDAVWEPAHKAIRKVVRRDALPETALNEAKKRFDDVRRPLPAPASKTPGLVVLGALLVLAALQLVRKARDPELLPSLKKSRPAYAYVVHSVLALGVLVILPLVIGAGTSLFAGRDEHLRYVGLTHFISILTARGGPLLATGSFYLVLLVTVLWTFLNVFFHVLIGVSLALVLSRPMLKMRGLYRVLLIIPWAVPSYVTALAWKGMFHRQFGAVTAMTLGLNRTLGLDIEPISWFSRFSVAFTANLSTNIWLGFPFMMVVTLGALTTVPDDVLEAAKVDGATRWQRLRLVTLPMIRPSLAPAVIMGAIWTFNMFNVIYLVSGGEPDGTTEILVSEAYRWAFTREAQYGYAAAYSVLIFLLLSGATRLIDWRREREVRRLARLAMPVAATKEAV